MEYVPITLDINGEVHRLHVDTTRTLVNVLRETLSLTGTKNACNIGVCGTCAVMIDGEAHRSCLTLAVGVQGQKIITIEGFGTDLLSRLVQESFVDSGAIQCGYCTSGMIAAAVDLLQRNRNPTNDEIRVGISGNLCRCSGYVKIIEAVRLAATKIANSRVPEHD